MTYVSPLTGLPLWHDTPHSVTAGADERWPVVDGIPYLRVGTLPLAQAALALLDAGDDTSALLLLLAENDRWWTEPPPSLNDLQTLIAQREQLTLRAAMDLLGFGRVGTYFAHRWSDPTYMAGLALMEAGWAEPKTSFDLACGIGHYVRVLQAQNMTTLGADVVFAKLWLARHWVVGAGAKLVCFDADVAWPVRGPFDLVTCHDAFYFFADPTHVATNLKACAAGGQLVVGHIHNAASPQFSGGKAASLSDLYGLFPGAQMYDDQQLTTACATGTPCDLLALPHEPEAFGLIHGTARAGTQPRPGFLSRPAYGTKLVRNPMCANGVPIWPTARYEAEYASRATYTCAPDIPAHATMGPEWTQAVARRELLDLPERW